MGMTQEKAVLKVEVQGTAQAERLMRSFGMTTEKEMSKAGSSTERNLARMAVSYLGLAKGIQMASKAITSGVNFNRFVEEQTMAFTVMMKSADLAKAKLDELYKFAVNSPLTFKETVSASKQLMAYGFAAEELVPTMKTLGTVAKATGHSLDDISYVYGTLKSQGRAYTRDLMQFGMRGIPIYEELAKVMGVDQKALKKLTEEGKVGFKEVEQAFKNMTSEGGRFGGLLDEYMKTFSGKLSMLKDIAEKSSGVFTASLFDGLKKGIESLTTILGQADIQEYIADMGATMGKVAEGALQLGIGLIKITPILTKLIPIFIAIMGAKALMGIPKALFMAADGVMAFGAALATGKFITMATGVSSLTTAFGQLGAFFATSAGGIILTLGVTFAGIAGSVYLVTKAIQGQAAELAKARGSQEGLSKTILEKESARFEGLGTSMSGMSSKEQLRDITAYASIYKTTSDVVAKILYENKFITAEIALQAGYDIKAKADALRLSQRALSYQERATAEAKRMAAVQAGMLEKYIEFIDKREFSKTLTALGVDPATVGGSVEPSAKQYVSAMEGTLPQTTLPQALKAAGATADIVENAYARVYQERFDKLQTAFSAIQLLFPNKADKAALKAELVKLMNEASSFLDKGAAEDHVKLDQWFDLDLMVKATESAYDDIALQRDKDIVDAFDKNKAKIISAEQLANALTAIDKKYYKDVAKMRYEDMKNGSAAKLAGLKATAGKGGLSGAGATMGIEMSGTDVGKLAMKANPLTMIAASAAQFLSSIENVSKSLNFIGTIFEGMRALLEPVLNTVFSGFVSALMEMGDTIAQILLPVFTLLGIVMQIFAGVMKLVTGVVKIFSTVFIWLSDKVLVPIGNVIIDILNGLIGAMNAVFKFLNTYLGTHIRLIATLNHLLTSEEAYNQELSKKVEELRATGLTDALNSTIAFLIKTLDDLADAQIQSAQDLYEVGAISGTQYGAMVDAANATRRSADDDLVNIADKQLAALGDQGAIALRLDALLDAQKIMGNTELTDAEKITLLSGLGLVSTNQQVPYVTPVPSPVPEPISNTTVAPDTTSMLSDAASGGLAGAAIGAGIGSFIPIVGTAIGAAVGGAIGAIGGGLGDLFGWWDVGSPNIKADQMGMVHKGEAIIPKTFAEGIRGGELTLSGKGANTSSGDTYITVQVSGSVTAENDLASAIAKRIHTQRSRGLLTV